MHRLALYGIMLCITLIGCGGGSGSGPGGSVRTVPLQFKVGSPLKYVDQASGISVQIAAGALPKSGAVTLQFSTSWLSDPPSKLVKRQAHVSIETDDALASGSVSVSTASLGERLPDAQFIAQNSDLTWHIVDTTRSNGVASALIPDPIYRSVANRGPKFKIHFDLSLVPYSADFSEKTVDLVLLGGQGDPNVISQPGSVILVHGMNNSVDDLNALAARLLLSKQFKAVYALKYPWATDIKQNAADFATLLPGHVAPGTKVPIIAHSMGGLIVSYAIEPLKMSDYVSQVVMIATPRQGSNLAGLTRFCRAEANANLNNAADTKDHWANLCDLNTVSMQQIKTDSSFLKELNAAASNHRNYVPYSLIAGTVDYLGSSTIECGESCDGLVTEKSLLDFAYDQNATLGSVMKYRAPFNHSNIIKKSGALDTIQNVITAGASKLGPTVTAVPENNAIATDTGWEVPFTLENATSAFDMMVEHLVMQTFDRNGDWKSTQWYTPNPIGDGFFPNVPFDWNYSLGSKQTYSRTPHLNFDTERHHYADAAYATKAQTAVFICSGRLVQTNDPFTIITTCIAKDKNGLGPLSPPRYVTVRSQSSGGAFSAR